MSALKFFTDKPLIAMTSDASIDFNIVDFDAPMSKDQQAYLKKETGVDIPRVFWRKQIHGDDVLVAKDVAGASTCPDADAYITNKVGVPIAIRTADCVPVFLYDPIQKAIGVVHAGWKGTHKQITAKTVKQMQRVFNCKPQDIQAVLGPSIRLYCYEVGPEFKEYFPEDVVERAGKLYVNVSHNNRRQLLSSGVSEANIHDSGVCTHCEPGYFSFRRDAERSGRMISLMMLK